MRRGRHAATRAELGFIAVNETHRVAHYRQAVLWLAGQGVVALSGVASPEDNAPFTRFVVSVAKRLHDNAMSSATQPIRPSDLDDQLISAWAEWLPQQALRVDLSGPDDARLGMLILARDEPWTPDDIELLQDWGETLGQSLSRFQQGWWQRIKPARSGKGRGSPLRLLRSRALWVGLVVVAVMLLPVHLTVLAPAELVPREPHVVRAPLDGVVERILVEPNARVERGQPLVEFDRVGVRNRLQVARREMARIDAEYRQQGQLALMREENKSALALLQAQKEAQQAEIAYLEVLDERGLITSPAAGVAIFDSATEWTGRPTVTGERIMSVAEETDAEIEAWLSPADLVPLEADAPVQLFLNADPLTGVAASLRYVAYRAAERPDGSFAYRVRARLSDQAAALRIGLKGTAKLEGEKVTLAYWLFRRPLAGLRAWLGI